MKTLASAALLGLLWLAAVPTRADDRREVTVDNVTDLQAELALGGIVHLLPGTYTITETLTITEDGTTLVGIPDLDGSLPVIQTVMPGGNIWMLQIAAPIDRGEPLRNVDVASIRFVGIGDIAALLHPELIIEAQDLCNGGW